MSEGTESSVEKTEKTVEGIVYAFGVYFRTFVTLALPSFLARHFFPRLRWLRKRKVLAPPLLFLSISTFLFSIVAAIIDAAEFTDARAAIRGFRDRVNLDISITTLLFTIFPIFLWALLVAWAGRLLVAGARRREQVSSYFCYIFGLFGAGSFLWFLLNSLVQVPLERGNYRLQHRLLDSLGLFLSVTILLWVVVQPFSLAVLTIWRLTRSEDILKRISKSAFGLLLLATMIIGSIFIQGIPRRLNEAIAKPPEPEKEAPIKFANWPQLPHALPDISSDGSGHLLIRFRIVAANPRDTTVFLDREMILVLSENKSDPIYIKLYDESAQPSDPLPLSPKQTRIIRCQGQLERSQYQKIVGRKMRFEILATWYDLTKGGLHGTSASIIDDEGYNMDF